jgi:hypothetical protein
MSELCQMKRWKAMIFAEKILHEERKKTTKIYFSFLKNYSGFDDFSKLCNKC